jgi:hypothetical protein
MTPLCEALLGGPVRRLRNRLSSRPVAHLDRAHGVFELRRLDDSHKFGKGGPNVSWRRLRALRGERLS